jgi:hypothetical protein
MELSSKEKYAYEEDVAVYKLPPLLALHKLTYSAFTAVGLLMH